MRTLACSGHTTGQGGACSRSSDAQPSTLENTYTSPLAVREGVATVRTAKLSTNEAVVDVTGTIDMADERLNLSVKPASLEWKFFSLRTPLYVRGTLGKPDVGAEPGPLLLRAGAAIAAAVAAPAALALIPVTVPGADDDAQCAPLLAQATQPVTAGRARAPATRTPAR